MYESKGIGPDPRSLMGLQLSEGDNFLGGAEDRLRIGSPLGVKCKYPAYT